MKYFIKGLLKLLLLFPAFLLVVPFITIGCIEAIGGKDINKSWSFNFSEKIREKLENI